MHRDRFIKELRKEAKTRGESFDVDKKLGKGSHYRVTLGSRKTTIKSGDLSPGYMDVIRKQLGLA